jgi:hypothetical protein
MADTCGNRELLSYLISEDVLLDHIIHLAGDTIHQTNELDIIPVELVKFPDTQAKAQAFHVTAFGTEMVKDASTKIASGQPVSVLGADGLVIEVVMTTSGNTDNTVLVIVGRLDSFHCRFLLK